MDDMKKCPACAEEIRAEALKCKHCGERLDAPIDTTPPVALHKMDLTPFFFPGLLSAGGALMFIYALTMDVTVPLAPSAAAILGHDRVANIHLIAQQSNLRNGGAFVFVLGFIWLFYAMRTTKPKAAEFIESDPTERGNRTLVGILIVGFFAILMAVAAQI